MRTDLTPRTPSLVFSPIHSQLLSLVSQSVVIYMYVGQVTQRHFEKNLAMASHPILPVHLVLLCFSSTLSRKGSFPAGNYKISDSVKMCLFQKISKSFLLLFPVSVNVTCIESLRYAKMEVRNTIIAFRKPLACNHK